MRRRLRRTILIGNEARHFPHIESSSKSPLTNSEKKAAWWRCCCQLMSKQIRHYSHISSCLIMFLFIFPFKSVLSFRQTSFSRRSLKLWSNNPKQLRLERIISNRGIGSRNDVSKLFKQGRVSIQGKVIRSGSDKYSTDVVVEIDGQSIIGVPLLAIFHKPTGVHSTMKDNWGRQGLEELALEYPYMKAMHPVGRLDADTSGLLLFSSDGHLTQMLLHPSTGVEREYEAIVVGTVDMNVLGPKLAAGITTTDGEFAANLLSSEPLETMARVPVLQPQVDDDCDDDDDGEKKNGLMKGNAGALVIDNDDLTAQDIENTKLVTTSKVVVSVTEGKYRMVRRVLHNAGHSVLQLHRVRYGSVFLNDLEGGEVRPCSKAEQLWAETLAKTISTARLQTMIALKSEKRISADNKLSE